MIDWTRIIGLRNKLAHDYGEVLAERIWIISREFVPQLLTILRKLLPWNQRFSPVSQRKPSEQRITMHIAAVMFRATPESFQEEQDECRDQRT